MPFIRSLASKRCTKLISTIISLNKIMPSCSRCVKRKLLYIAIVALSSRQPSFYTKYTRANMRAFYNIYLILDMEYIFFIHFIIF